MTYLFPELIKKKRAGLEHTREELQFIVDGFVSGAIPEYQMSAWLMAVYFKSMTSSEAAMLTEVMLHSGRVLDFSHLPTVAVDKHSTGGVGDKTSMLLAPIVAAAGGKVPMIAGRGLGHTGGTLDKLEAIPGFRVDLDLQKFSKLVETLGASIIGQTGEICPADKKIYALRDVTATVESLPLICASIMSKKIAEGIGALVLDVKYGSGAFMKTAKDADTLAEKLIEIGRAHGKKVSAYVTNMDQPLGRFIGNALEIGECLAILKNEPYLGRDPRLFDDTRELSLHLAAEMLRLSGVAKDFASGRKLAEDALVSGKAYAKFEEMCRAQGGDLSKLPGPTTQVTVVSDRDGFIGKYETEQVGYAALALGAGRLKSTDTVDFTAGIEVHKRIGESVKRGEVLFTLFANRKAEDPAFEVCRAKLLSATSISLQKTDAPSLIALERTH